MDRLRGRGRAPAGGAGRAHKSTLPNLPTVSFARKELAGLKTAAPASMRGYSRAKFPHWAEHGEHCDTRETILNRDGTHVKRDAQCRAISGHRVSVYDGKKATAASQLDLDHTVPLANALSLFRFDGHQRCGGQAASAAS
nr:hypothetical protein StreXyl84_77860 [Streptomyces sp. Xyl84]